MTINTAMIVQMMNKNIDIVIANSDVCCIPFYHYAPLVGLVGDSVDDLSILH
tara:strand:+ start:3880 stop:4035 length:156 start_codon:yes stop_codon:yes gene_type:complete